MKENKARISYINEIATTSESSKKFTTHNLNLRAGYSTNYDVILTIPKGAEVEVIPEREGWSAIRYNGTVGFVSNKYLTDRKEVSTTKKYVNVTSLNFRTGPSIKDSIISTLTKGTGVDVISTENGWAYIVYNGKKGYVSSKYLSEKTSSINESPMSTSAEEIISYAKKLLGKKYIWSHEGPDTFDCSGFTWYVYKNVAGISLPRNSTKQGNYGTYVSRKDLQPGDLVFFDTVGARDNVISHVGIYLGNNEFIHASSSQGKVVISKLENYYLSVFVNGRRVLK